MNGVIQSSKAKIAILALAVLLLAVCMALSVVFGYTDTSWKTAVAAFTDFNGSNQHLIIRNARLPRALIGAAVGISLALAGVLLQAVTRNPIASTDIFGLNAGAGFFIVMAVSFFQISSLQQFTWIAFLGATVSALAVYILGSAGRSGLTPIKMTLAGAVIAAMFASLTQGMLVANQKALEEVLFWLAGSIQGRKLEFLYPVLPYLLIAWIGSLLMFRQLNTFLLGEDVAKSLGQRTLLFKVLAGVLIVLLAGGSVAVAGPISFIGIVVPHFARYLVGNDHRWVIPFSAVFGGILLITADIGARYIVLPEEVPVGVMTALIGTPFFIHIARKGSFK
ncbi:iron ABC transporter permease [Fictibacillus enclensis]|uniref:Iron ABC transporter n=1 Tax=Fictibacillus enclensis TaxID=1017270 RepID=A0A0V8JC55_9BACL|nr:iron ABC transporter permease [Fictibacillus enclensis]KSU84759.1 iron ABC transporter [Fictibacillus enclensis]MDM5337712.1 iron ABC transporter permease [Fictibacillus enclensis]SCB85118.1 iron complex transport system permease protein [Fictibacillus enclensis]